MPTEKQEEKEQNALRCDNLAQESKEAAESARDRGDVTQARHHERSAENLEEKAKEIRGT